MAFGVPPRHTEELFLNNFTPREYLALAVEAAKKIDWRIDELNEDGFIAAANRSDVRWKTNVIFHIEGDRATVKSESRGGEMMDFGRNRKTVKKFTDALVDLKYSLTADELHRLYGELSQTFTQKDESALKTHAAAGQLDNFFSIFIPSKNFFVTPLLIDVNIIIWFMMVLAGINWLQPETDSMIAWGANFRPLTLSGQWWRLLSNCFLHFGVFHLLMNMYALLYIGLLLEPYLGRLRFFAAYILTGIAASVVSLWWHDFTVSAGASGAIFGMYGLFLAMLTTNLIEKNARKALLSSIGIFVGYNLLNGMKGGVDNAAHIGGLICGIVAGYAYLPTFKETATSTIKYSVIAGLGALVFCSSFIVFNNLSNDVSVYQEKMRTFAEMETAALTVYSLPDNTPHEKLLFEIKNTGLSNWHKSLDLINETDKLNIPEALHSRNKTFQYYCELRIESYELLYKAVDENTGKYKEELEDYNRRIQTVIDNMGKE